MTKVLLLLLIVLYCKSKLYTHCRGLVTAHHRSPKVYICEAKRKVTHDLFTYGEYPLTRVNVAHADCYEQVLSMYVHDLLGLLSERRVVLVMIDRVSSACLVQMPLVFQAALDRR